MAGTGSVNSKSAYRLLPQTLAYDNGDNAHYSKLRNPTHTLLGHPFSVASKAAAC